MIDKHVWCLYVHDSNTTHKIFSKYYRSKESAFRAALNWIYKNYKDFGRKCLLVE